MAAKSRIRVRIRVDVPVALAWVIRSRIRIRIRIRMGVPVALARVHQGMRLHWLCVSTRRVCDVYLPSILHRVMDLCGGGC